ncbi:hypothetical protein A2U01_0102490, partial [Trifolium medium]|nr:hypothetical protein [Trifolium medium]
KVVEECGYTLGDDSCLFEDEKDSEASEPEYEEGYGDPDTRRHMDALVEKIAEDFNEAEGLGVQEKRPVSSKGGV